MYNLVSGKNTVKYLVIILILFTGLKHANADPHFSIEIYGMGCLSCFHDYSEGLAQAVQETGVTEIHIIYTQGNSAATKALENARDKIGVPEDMRGQISTIIDERYAFEGEIPYPIILDFLANYTQDYSRIIVYRDELTEVYRIKYDEDGDIIECQLNSSISECREESIGRTPLSILALVLVSGLLDGVNPCAFAVLLFFVGLLLTAGLDTAPEKEKRVLKIGSVYIASVFTAYTLIGLGLYEAIVVLDIGSIPEIFGASLMILLGLINLRDYFLNRGFTLKIPFGGLMRIYDWINKMTIPATIVAGFLVSIFEFPCTGGVYFGIIALLASKGTLTEGIAYLLAYNIAFILPLIAVFALAVSGCLERRNLGREAHRRLKLLSGVVLIALGLILLLTDL